MISGALPEYETRLDSVFESMAAYTVNTFTAALL